MTRRRVTRSRALPEAGGRTLFFTFMTRRLQFLSPEQVPAFDGDHAWFEITRVKGAWQFGRRLDEPAKPLPSAQPLLHDADAPKTRDDRPAGEDGAP